MSSKAVPEQLAPAPPTTGASCSAAVFQSERPLPAILTDSQLADLYADHKARVDLFKPTGDYCDALAKEIRRRFDDKPAAQSFTLTGTRSVIQVGPRRNETVITSIVQLYKRSKLTIQDFLAQCSITIDAARKMANSAPLIETKQTGYRDLKAIALPQEKAA